uniref:Uncharacterized protein n=1 Tax=Cajanus cajan TaxID=3821 RepID=A0A151T6V2_CAJCA|nr:hypothetical protein KK1_017333 [Cajanus cajan]
MPHPKVSKEMATKWNPILNRATNEFTMIYSRNILKDKKLVRGHNPFVTAFLEEQLLQTQRSINKVKAEQKSMKKNIEQFLQNIKEESIFWKQRQHHKVVEDKYKELVQLAGSLQMFLISKGAELDTEELEDAEWIKQQVESVNIQGILQTI